MKKSKMKRKLKALKVALSVFKQAMCGHLDNIREDHNALEEVVNEFIENGPEEFNELEHLEPEGDHLDGDGEGGGVIDQSVGERADNGDEEANEQLQEEARELGVYTGSCDSWKEVEVLLKQARDRRTAQEAGAPGPDSSIGDGGGLGGADLLRHPSLP